MKYVNAFVHSVTLLYRVEKGPVVVLAVALLLSVPIIPLEIALIKTIVDRIQAWTAPDSVNSILVVAAELALLMVIGNIALGVPVPMAMTRLSEIGPIEEQRLLMRKNARLPLAALEMPATKDLLERALMVSHHEMVQTSFHMVQIFLQIVIMIAFLLSYGQWIPVACIAAAALYMFYASGTSAEKLEGLVRHQTADRRLLHHYADLMTKRDAAKEIRLFGLGSLLAARWSSLYEWQSQQTLSFIKASELRKLLPELVMAILSGLILALLVILPGSQQRSSGDFAFLLLALTMLFSQLPTLLGQGVSMRKLSMRWQDFHIYMGLDEARSEAEIDVSISGSSALSLQVREVRYRYPGADHDAINGINLTIPPGCRAALVGENGSGKSTLVKLLSGMYEPNDGTILWSQGEESGADHAAASGQFSAVFQDFARLYVTIRENVALGKLSAMGQDNILRDNLLAVGSKFSDLDKQLGTAFGGIEPSGGEWQRIVTARSLLRDSAFVFFDEPTAALDPQAERDAFDLFLRVTVDRSALLVTHRLGAAKLADVIFVMKQGKLVEHGTHVELMGLDGEYSKMFRLQASWYV